jgi:hypothetical protein
MKLITAIGFAIFLFISIGLISYLVKLNRQAKKQQSEVDPAKLRAWEDD